MDVAGPRESLQPGLGSQAKVLLREILTELKDHTGSDIAAF